MVKCIKCIGFNDFIYITDVFVDVFSTKCPTPLVRKVIPKQTMNDILPYIHINIIITVQNALFIFIFCNIGNTLGDNARYLEYVCINVRIECYFVFISPSTPKRIFIY